MEKKGSFKNGRKKDKRYRVSNDIELMAFLQTLFPDQSRNTIKSYLKHRQIAVNGRTQTLYNYALTSGDEVWWKGIGEEKPNPNRKVRILYEDEVLMVVEKKLGVPTSSREAIDETVVSLMKAHLKKREPEAQVYTINRLEHNVSGILILAKNEEIRDILLEAWYQGMIKMTYVGVVEGQMPDKEGLLVHYQKESLKNKRVYFSEQDNGGNKAETYYKVLKENERYSLVRLEMHSMVKNQLRGQLAFIGHPLAGDKRNGAHSNPLSRLSLHAQKLYFKHPFTLEPFRFDTGVPACFK